MMKRKTIAIAVSIISLLSFLAINAATAAEFAVDPYTVALWHLNEGVDVVANDETGVNDGTIYGAAWTTGRYGNALSFDGDDYVEVPYNPSLDITDQITLEAWIKPAVTTQEQFARIVMKGSKQDASGPMDIKAWQYFLTYDITGTYVRMLVFLQTASGLQGFEAKSTTPITDTLAWYQICGTYNGAEVKIYVNGVSETTTPATGKINTNTQGVSVGGDHAWTSDHSFKGIIDEVRISNVARTPVDIEPGADVVNLKSHANWFTAYLELFGNDPSAVDLTKTILWFDAEHGAEAECDPKYGFVSDPTGYSVDIDGDGAYERMVKFDKYPTIDSYLDNYIGQEITLTVEYAIGANTYYASYTVMVIKPGKS
jgi:hypothetical protein